jgi:hypothetical protein
MIFLHQAPAGIPITLTINRQLNCFMDYNLNQWTCPNDVINQTLITDSSGSASGSVQTGGYDYLNIQVWHSNIKFFLILNCFFDHVQQSSSPMSPEQYNYIYKLQASVAGILDVTILTAKYIWKNSLRLNFTNKSYFAFTDPPLINQWRLKFLLRQQHCRNVSTKWFLKESW